MRALRLRLPIGQGCGVSSWQVHQTTALIPRVSASEGTREISSRPAMPSGSRLVARIRSCGQARSRASASVAHASTRCSQLSSTSSSCRRAADRAAWLSSRPARPPRACPARRPRPAAPASGSASGGQLDEPDAVRKCAEQAGGDLERQAGLADAARAGERQQARPAQQPAGLGDLRSRPMKLVSGFGRFAAVARARAAIAGGWGVGRHESLDWQRP